MESGLDAKPTIEALENERRRLQELERNLAAERRRVQDTAAREIARMQTVLREAAERAAGRERELDAARKRLERKLEGGRIGRLAAFRERSAGGKETRDLDRRERLLVEQAGALSARADELRAGEAELERKLEQLLEAERLSFEQLAKRAAGLDAREESLKDERGPVGDGQQAELQHRAEALADRQAEIEERAARLEEEATAIAARQRQAATTLEALVAAQQENEAALARRTSELTAREAALARRERELAPRVEGPAWVVASLDLRAEQEDREARLDEVEQRAASLTDRATVLDAREAELAETVAALEQRERELALLRDELDAERRRLADRSRRLAEVERSSPIRPAHQGRSVGFSEGLRELARRRSAV